MYVLYIPNNKGEKWTKGESIHTCQSTANDYVSYGMPYKTELYVSIASRFWGFIHFLSKESSNFFSQSSTHFSDVSSSFIFIGLWHKTFCSRIYQKPLIPNKP